MRKVKAGVYLVLVKRPYIMIFHRTENRFCYNRKTHAVTEKFVATIESKWIERTRNVIYDGELDFKNLLFRIGSF